MSAAPSGTSAPPTERLRDRRPGSTLGPVGAVLFDADGVLQRPTIRWRPALQAAFQLDGDALDRFTGDVAALETDYLERTAGFPEALSRLLAARGYDGRLDDALRIFNAIDADPGILAIVRDLRQRGVLCCLATNQQSHRAMHMSEQLRYQQLFDREFYSCRMGVAKPKRAFFAHVLAKLGLPASAVLFIDDREENVRSAQAAGLHAVTFHEQTGAGVLRDQLIKYNL